MNKVREFITVKNKLNHPTLQETRSYEWGVKISCVGDLYVMLCELFVMDRLTIERSYVIALDHANKIKGIYQVGQGDANESHTSMQNIFTFLLLVGANSFMIAHNHVSDMPNASEADKTITAKAGIFADMFGMEFIGHMIISPNTYIVDGGTMDGTSYDDEFSIPYEDLGNGMGVTYIFGERIEDTIDKIKEMCR